MNKIFSKYLKNYPAGYALLAAVLFGLNAPLSKLLLNDVPPLFMAAFLYLGAGAGMMILHFFNVEKKEAHLSKKEFPLRGDFPGNFFMNISIKSAVTAIFLPLMFLQSSGKEIFVSPGGILPPFRSQSGGEIAILQRFPVRALEYFSLRGYIKLSQGDEK